MVLESEMYSKKPSVYTSTKVLENCAKYEKKGVSYSASDCAVSIASQLPFGTTNTSIPAICNQDAIAIIDLEKTGGFEFLLEGAIVVVYLENKKKPWNHGGIYYKNGKVYETTPGLKVFQRSNFSRQKWNKVVWLRGMILSPEQMDIIGSFIFTVRENEEGWD